MLFKEFFGNFAMYYMKYTHLTRVYPFGNRLTLQAAKEKNNKQ